MTREQLIRQSQELNIFFARGMKEHCAFMSRGFFASTRLAQTFDRYKINFEMLLSDSLEIGTSFLGEDALTGGENLTEFTIEAEERADEFCGSGVNRQLTAREAALIKNPPAVPAGKLPMIFERVISRDKKAREFLKGVSDVLATTVNGIEKGKIFCPIFPSYIRHFKAEADKYLKNVQTLLNGSEPPADAIFWARVCKEHAEFIRHSLDPSERELCVDANDFARRFAEGCVRADSSLMRGITNEFIVFQKTVCDSLLSNKTAAVLTPLHADHMLRQALYFIRTAF